jgi:hypothetical protein
MKQNHPGVDMSFARDMNGAMYLMGIEARTPRQGDGGRAMTEFTKWLDENGHDSALVASPKGDMPLSKLVEFYERHGYTVAKEQLFDTSKALQMHRVPKKESGSVESQRPEARPASSAPDRGAGAQAEGVRPEARAEPGRVEPEQPASERAAAQPERPAEEVAPEAKHEAAIRSWIKSFRGGIGRDEVGGRLIIDEVNRGRVPGSGDVLGRTQHLGDPMWFGRPDPGLSATAARNAIDKYLAGERLGKREQRYIDYLRDHAETAERDMAQELREHPEAARADVDEALNASHELDASFIEARLDDLESGRLSEAAYERELQSGTSEKAQEADRVGNREAPEAEAARPGDAADRGEGREDFGLEQPTPEQLREREQQRVDGERAAEREGQRAERERQRELDAAERKAREERVRKERADAAADDFQLGQEPPRKKVTPDEAAGQRDLMDNAGVDDAVRARQAGEAKAADEGRWQRLMAADDDAKADAVAGEMTRAEATAAIDRLDAAPGDNTRARAALERRRASSGGPGSKLYSGLPLDEMFKWLGRGVERITGPASEWKAAAFQLKDMAKAVADAFAKQGQHIFGDVPGESPIGKLARTMLYNVHSHIVAFGEAWHSPTIQKIADMIYPTAGKEQAGQSFHEATESHVAQRQKDLEDIRAELDRLNTAGVTDAQVIRMIENPHSRQGKAGQLAAKIAQWLKEERDYQREAGVDIGTVQNYFPREYDRSKIIPQRAAFIADATRAYEKMGLPHDEAARAADAFWYRRTYGADGTPGTDFGGAGNPLFTRTREFTPEAARELEKWRTASVSDTLEAYLMRSTRLSEITRRFGYSAKELQAMRDRGGAKAVEGKEGAWGKWGEMERKIHDEAPGLHSQEIHELRAMVASAMGFRPPTMGSAVHQASQWLRMWTGLATMPKSVFSSISESVAPIFRANGDLAVAATQLRNVLTENVKSLLKQAAGEGRTEHMQKLFDFGEDIGVLVESSVASPMRDRWLGDDVTNKRVAGMTAKFFKLNMLDQLTNWQRALGIDASRVFVRRMATRGGNASEFYLKELGVPAEKVKEFSAFVKKLGDDLPDASQLGGEMGQIYRNAMVRFSDQSIQRPNAATRPKWANTELGSVVFQLQGFANAYHKNVLLRQKNLMVEAVKGDYTTAERAQLMGGMIPGMMLSAAVAGLVWEVRDRLYNKTPPDRSMRAKIERALSGSGAFGALDPFFNMIGGLRYQKTPASAASGPAVGALNDVLTTLGNYVMNNSDKTNTAERRAADVFYQWAVEPAATALMAATPAPVAPLTQALTVLALPAARQRFVDYVAGQKAKKPQQIRGVTEGRAPPKSEMTWQQRLEAERYEAQQ